MFLSFTFGISLRSWNGGRWKAEGGEYQRCQEFCLEASVPNFFVCILFVFYVVWEKSETLLLHLHGLVSPVDLSLLCIYCGPMRWANQFLDAFRNEYLPLVLPEAFAREQARMLVNVLQGHVTSHSVFYSFEIPSASMSYLAH